jgi:hypothetical protein
MRRTTSNKITRYRYALSIVFIVFVVCVATVVCSALAKTVVVAPVSEFVTEFDIIADCDEFVKIIVSTVLVVSLTVVTDDAVTMTEVGCEIGGNAGRMGVADVLVVSGGISPATSGIWLI